MGASAPVAVYTTFAPTVLPAWFFLFPPASQPHLAQTCQLPFACGALPVLVLLSFCFEVPSGDLLGHRDTRGWVCSQDYSSGSDVWPGTAGHAGAGSRESAVGLKS